MKSSSLPFEQKISPTIKKYQEFYKRSIRDPERFWAEEARKAGEVPIVLHIPKKSVVECVASGETPAHYYVLRELEKDGIIVVDPVGEMVGKHRLYKHSHFSSRGGRIVARVLADAILKLLKKNTPPVPPVAKPYGASPHTQRSRISFR